MRAVLWFGLGIAIAFVLMLLTGVVILKTVAGGFRADAKPTAAEAWAARTARNYAMPSAAKQRTNPIPASSTVLVEARATGLTIAPFAMGTMAAAKAKWANICTHKLWICAISRRKK